MCAAAHSQSVLICIYPQVPLQLIESAECRDMFQLHVTCKDCKVIRYDQSSSSSVYFTFKLPVI